MRLRETHYRSISEVAPVKSLFYWVGALALVSLGVSVGWSAPGFTAQLDRNVVPVGESVTLSLVFEDIKPAGAPALPPLQNLTVAGSVGQSSQMTFVNGQRSESLTLTYTLVATAPGDVVIPSISVPANGRTFTSQPIQLKIVPANSAAPNPAATITNLAFIRLIVPKTDVYVGEPFAVEMHLYWQNAQDIRMPQLRAEGFSLGQMPKPAQTRTQVGNAIYNLAIFKLTATAARTGPLALGPVEGGLTILVPVNNPRRSRDPFESFFGGPQYRQFPTILTSEVVSMHVLSLPVQNVPETFHGAIGNYQLSVTAGPTNVGVGDPITVRVRISGRGPIDSLTLPPQPQWRDFTTYPPTAKVETSDDLGLAGTKSFEQVIIPQNHEIRTLPPVVFSFFDPGARTYRTLTSQAVPLTVRPSGVVAVPPPSLTNASSATTPPPVDDILHIKPRLELSASVAPSLIFRPWFLVLQGLPPLIWLSLLTWRKRTESLARNPRLRRQREVAQRVREGLKDLHRQVGAQKPSEFFATLFRLLQEQLGERLDLPASAITEAVIDERLHGRGLSDETLQSLRALFQTCNLARYAPVQTSQELAALIPRAEGALRDLQQLKT